MSILLSDIEFPSQFTLEIHIIPYSDTGVILATGDNEWPLQTYIHTGNGTAVETVEEIVEVDFLGCREQVVDGTDKGSEVEGGYVVTLETHCYYVTLGADVDVADATPPVCHECPFQHEFVVLHPVIILVYLHVQCQMPLVTPYDEPTAESTDCCQVHVLLVETVLEYLLHFVVLHYVDCPLVCSDY